MIDALTKRAMDGGTEVVQAGKGSAILSMAYAGAPVCLRGESFSPTARRASERRPVSPSRNRRAGRGAPAFAPPGRSGGRALNMLRRLPYAPPAWAKGLKAPAERYQLGVRAGRSRGAREAREVLTHAPDQVFPTPVHPWQVPGVPAGVEVFAKRDDLSGMQLSGNKVRCSRPWGTGTPTPTD